MPYRTLLSLSLMAALGGALRADWKVTTVSTYDDGHNHSRWIDTEYYKNDMKRSDNVDPDTGKLRFVTVMDRHGTRWTWWDLTKREYSIQTFHPTLAAQQAGPGIVYDVENTESGERRTFFGRVARRVITLQSRHAAGGAVESESQIDGWYIDSNTLPEEIRNPRFAVLTSALGHPSITVHRRGAENTGLAVSSKRTETWISPTGERVTSESTSEVTELFEGSLDAALFQPPTGFRRAFYNCLAISWRDKLDCFEDWASALAP